MTTLKFTPEAAQTEMQTIELKHIVYDKGTILKSMNE